DDDDAEDDTETGNDPGHRTPPDKRCDEPSKPYPTVTSPFDTAWAESPGPFQELGLSEGSSSGSAGGSWAQRTTKGPPHMEASWESGKSSSLSCAPSSSRSTRNHACSVWSRTESRSAPSAYCTTGVVSSSRIWVVVYPWSWRVNR